MPITFLEGSHPYYPETISWHGQTLHAHYVCARNVHVGDVVAFADCTGQPGTAAPIGFGAVDDVVSHPSGLGRGYVPPWRRRELWVASWETVPGIGGLASWMLPRGSLTYAHADRVLVYRVSASGATRARRDVYGRLSTRAPR